MRQQQQHQCQIRSAACAAMQTSNSESSVKMWSTRMESSSDQGSPRARVVHYLHVVVASYTESCPETLCSRNALQQQLGPMHNSDAGDSCQAAIGPSPKKKEKK